MKRCGKTVAVLLAVCLMASAVFRLSAKAQTSTELPESIRSEYLLTVNLDTDTVLYERHADELVFCGFLPRILLCAMLLDSGRNLSEQVTITKAMLNETPKTNLTLALKDGDTMTLEDMAKSVLGFNAQEGCVALACALFGSTAAAVRTLNDKAAELGMTATTLTNVHGDMDDNPGWTTLQDVMKAVRYALGFERFKDYTNPGNFVAVSVNGNGVRIANRNSVVVSSGDNEYYIKKALGVAAWSPSATNHTQWKGSACDFILDNNMRLVTILVSFDGLGTAWNDMRTMLSLSSANYKTATVVKENQGLCEVAVECGKERDRVIAAAASALISTIPESRDVSEFTCEIDVPESVLAPVSKGQVLGKATYFLDGKEAGTVELVAQTDVDANEIELFTRRINTFFSRGTVWLILLGIVVILAGYTILSRKFRDRRKKNKRVRIRLD